MQNDNRTSTNQTMHAYQSVSKAQDNLDLREFWRTLVHQKRMILSILGAVILLTLLYTFLSDPVYRATAKLQIEREPTKVVDIKFLDSGDIRDTRDFYQTQFELIKSRALAKRVIDKLSLHDSLEESFWQKMKSSMGLISEDSKQFALENALLENLNIEPIKNSRLVAVHFDSSDREQSSIIANTVIDTFQKMNMERRISAAQDAKTFLTSSISDAKGKLEESEKALNTYARENEIIQLGDDESTIDSHALNRLTEKLSIAENERLELESQYNLLNDDSKGEDRFASLNSSRLKLIAQSLRSAKADLERTNSRSAKRKVRDLQAKLDVEINTVRGILKGDLDAAKRKENLLREKQVQLKSEALVQQDLSVKYKTLRREVDTNQVLYQNLLQRLKEISIAGAVGSNNILVVDQAQPPVNKFKPSLKTNLLFATLLGLLIGMAAAFLREFMDDSVKNISELERATNLPVLGAIPDSPNESAQNLAELTLTEPKSPIAEAFRSLRTTLRFLLRDNNGGNTIFLTSARADEGKTTSAANLAYAYANTGNKVLLIDADLRNPSIHKTLGIAEGNGLVDFLAGRSALNGILKPTQSEHLNVITAGNPPKDPVELLSGHQLKTLMDAASEHFDMVIIDGPPVLGLADAQILASMSNITVLTVRASETRMAAVENALKRLRQTGTHIPGIIVNRIDTSGRMGYYDHEYYHYPTKENSSNK